MRRILASVLFFSAIAASALVRAQSPSVPTAASIIARVVTIPAGTFTMGGGDDDAQPLHAVELTAYSIGKYEITDVEYKAFIDATHHPVPSLDQLPAVVEPDREAMFRHFGERYVWKNGTYPEGKADHPVVLVRYDDAVAFCEWLSKAAGKRVHLPTEAQWERAARGGVGGKPYAWGDTLSPEKANYLKDDAAKETSGTKPVGSYAPNAFGLYDMNGNAWEWVADWYKLDYYRESPGRNPLGPPVGTMRIVRGGAWLDGDPALLDLSHRHEAPADTYSYSIGFRIVVE